MWIVWMNEGGKINRWIMQINDGNWSVEGIRRYGGGEMRAIGSNEWKVEISQWEASGRSGNRQSQVVGSQVNRSNGHQVEEIHGD